MPSGNAASKKKKKDPRHLECRLTLRMATKKELKHALNENIGLLKYNEEEDFMWATSSSTALALDLELNFMVPLATQAYYTQKLCNSSTIKIRNWKKDDGEDTFLGKKVTCFDVESCPSNNPTDNGFKLKVTIRPRLSADPELREDDESCDDDEDKDERNSAVGNELVLDGLYLVDNPLGPPVKLDYVVAKRFENKDVLFLVESERKDDTNCSCGPQTCEACSIRTYGEAYRNIVKAEHVE